MVSVVADFLATEALSKAAFIAPFLFSNLVFSVVGLLLFQTTRCQYVFKSRSSFEVYLEWGLLVKGRSVE